ncbi:MAG TPA: cell division protein FtsL [Pseudomonadales bacterium]
MNKANTASMVRPYGTLENEFWTIGQKITVSILLLLVMASAIGVVYSVHLSRKTVAALSVLDKQQHAIEVEWGQLLIEQSAWGDYGRVEKIAVERLDMKMPEPDRIVMLKKL